MIKNLFIAIAFALMLINPSIAIAAESPIDVQEIFTSSENIDGDNFKYPKGKAEMRLIRVEVENGGTIPMHSCLLYTSPSPRDRQKSRMPSSA